MEMPPELGSSDAYFFLYAVHFPSIQTYYICSLRFQSVLIFFLFFSFLHLRSRRCFSPSVTLLACKRNTSPYLLGTSTISLLHSPKVPYQEWISPNGPHFLSSPMPHHGTRPSDPSFINKQYQHNEYNSSHSSLLTLLNRTQMHIQLKSSVEACPRNSMQLLPTSTEFPFPPSLPG